MPNLKNNLKIYMQHFPNSFVGFFRSTSEVIYDLGKEWEDINPIWCASFIDISNKIKEIADNLNSLQLDFERNQTNTKSLIDAYSDKIHNIIGIKK